MEPSRKTETGGETGRFYLRLKPHPSQIAKLPGYFCDRVDIESDRWPLHTPGSMNGVWLRVNQDLIDRLHRKRLADTCDPQQRDRTNKLLKELQSTGKFPEIKWPN